MIQIKVRKEIPISKTKEIQKAISEILPDEILLIDVFPDREFYEDPYQDDENVLHEIKLTVSNLNSSSFNQMFKMIRRSLESTISPCYGLFKIEGGSISNVMNKEFIEKQIERILSRPLEHPIDNRKTISDIIDILGIPLKKESNPPINQIPDYKDLRERRDRFASSALDSIMNNYPFGLVMSGNVKKNIIRLSYEYADKMIIESDKFIQQIKEYQ